MSEALDWLLAEGSPGVRLRARRELLGEAADAREAAEWIGAFMPARWWEEKGLWLIYRVNALAECGLTGAEVDAPWDEVLERLLAAPFEFGCEDFLLLRALVMLGFAEEPRVRERIDGLASRCLPDGGFLCLRRLEKLRRVPKSCVKSDLLALLFCAEAQKRGVETGVTRGLIDYFWKHNVFYRTDDPARLMLDAREGWRSVDVFYPFEVMRVGLQNIVEAFCALGHGRDERLAGAWALLEGKKDARGRIVLEGTLTKSYLPKERVGMPSQWATLYALLAEKRKKKSDGLLPA